MGEEIYRDNEKIITGIEKLADTVKVTMGPEGKTVVIFDHELNKYILTKDGVSVSNSIFLQDPIENIGAQLVKEVAQKTVKEAGDGTTTSIVLTQALLKDGLNFLRNGKTITDLRYAFEALRKDVLSYIKSESKYISKDNIRSIAYISANNDNEIANFIQDAFNYSRNVQVAKGNDENTYIEYRDGIEYNVTYIDKKFITDDRKKIAKVEDAKVLLIDGKLTDLNKIQHILQNVSSENVPLVIFADDFSEGVLNILKSNHLNGAIKLLPIRTPGMGRYRIEYLMDLKLITNGEIVDLSKIVRNEVLGSVQSVVCDSEKTLIIPSEDDGVSELHTMLLTHLEDKGLAEYDRERIERRLDNIGGKCAIINVGAKSELEQKEKYDRVEDAVLACKSALEEGIIIGGGRLLENLRGSLKGYSPILTNWMASPYNTIIKNGYTGDYTNVNDPAKVLRCAVENAFSVVSQILTISTVVTNPFPHGQF